LNIPVKHSKAKPKDIQVDSVSTETTLQVTRDSVEDLLFWVFEDDIRPFFESTNSIDLNFETLEIISKCLRVKFDYITTSEYAADPSIISDCRYLADGKRSLLFERYTQVFDDKHGFVNNLSVLDLLFNEGKFTLDYLQNQKLTQDKSDYYSNDSCVIMG
jgi:hypothetical protein